MLTTPGLGGLAASNRPFLQKASIIEDESEKRAPIMEGVAILVLHFTMGIQIGRSDRLLPGHSFPARR